MASKPDRRLSRKRHVEEYVLGVGDLVAHFERRTVGLRGPRVEQAEPRHSERKRQGSAELERLAAREIWQTGRGRGRSSCRIKRLALCHFAGHAGQPFGQIIHVFVGRERGAAPG